MKKLLSIFSFLIAALVCFATNHVPNIDDLQYALIPAIVDSSAARAAYERVKEMASKWNFIIAPGDIRSEVKILNTLTTYDFPIRDVTMQGQIATRPLMKGVQDNDLFIAFKHGFFIDCRVALATNVLLQSYANATHFTLTARYADLNAFFNGLVTIQVGSTQFIQQLSTSKFLRVPEAQKSLAANETQFSFEENLVDLGVYSIYSGAADNKVKVDIKSYTSFAPEPASTENVFTYWAAGIIISNGAEKFEDFRKVIAPRAN